MPGSCSSVWCVQESSVAAAVSGTLCDPSQAGKRTRRERYFGLELPLTRVRGYVKEVRAGLRGGEGARESVVLAKHPAAGRG